MSDQVFIRNSQASFLKSSAIKSVSYYSCVGTTCDRCGQGIRHVARVNYVDGEVQSYGMDCILIILGTAPDLKKRFIKDAKLSDKYSRYLEILSRPPENMPYGSEYFGSGLYFIADDDGKDINFDGHWEFHPIFDVEKNQSGHKYVQNLSPEEYRAKHMSDIEAGKVWLAKEIARLELFMGRVIVKASKA